MLMPDWITVRYNEKSIKPVADYIEQHGVDTVCESALCPNRWECYANKELTFMILGERCTRRCGFCAVSKGVPEPVDEHEGEAILDTVTWLGADYAVVTSVTRDDLPDKGASLFAKVIGMLRDNNIHTEVLIPDFDEDERLIKKVVDAGPDVIAHNIETVQSLYPHIRPLSDYATSLGVLARIKNLNKKMITKSGFMLGLGEDIPDAKDLMKDIRETGCDSLTIGQYLRPSDDNEEVRTYLHPEVFNMLETFGYDIGFKAVRSAPFVRSSYRAREMWMEAVGKKGPRGKGCKRNEFGS
jgi:lipoic acid synthetase